MTKEKPIRIGYLAGTSYCGSTMMALLTNSHPQICSVGEACLNRSLQRKGGLDYPCSCGKTLSDCEFWNHIFHAVQEKGFELSAEKWTYDYRYKNPVLHKILTLYPSSLFYRAFQQIAGAIFPGHGKRIAHIQRVNVAFVRSVLDLTKTDVFFDTSKALMRLSFLLENPAFDVRVVRIIRDVRAFANSSVKRGETLSIAAEHWKNYQQTVYHLTASVSPDKVMILRYEDLCGNPSHALQAVYRFLGLDAYEPPDAIDWSSQHIIGNSIRLRDQLKVRLDESWRTKLSDADLNTVLAIAGEINRDLGYTE
ncbi:MAG: sulfotransferase [Nitrospiria bacterium]